MQTVEDLDRTESQDSAAPSPVRGHRTAILAGVGIGVAVMAAVIGWVSWQRLTAPAQPRLATAGIGEVFDYIADPRGFAALAKFDQDRYFEELKRHYREDQPHRALKKYLDDCPEDRLNLIRETMEPVVLRQVIATAREYQGLPAERRYVYLAAFREKAEGDSRWIRGGGDPEKDLSGRISTGLPNTPEQILKYVNAKIKPDDLRAIQSFAADFQRWSMQQKKQRPH